MNSFFGTTHLFSSYTIEHIILLIAFTSYSVWFVKTAPKKSEDRQRKILLGIAIILSSLQILKIPLNLYTGTFDITKDIPLHMCNFLPFVMIWVYSRNDRKTWATVFFWVILGVSQANFTPSIQFSLFHYDAIRYWSVHLFLVLLAIYPAVVWGWELTLKDVFRTVVALNVVAALMYFVNLALNSNYLYIMGKPPGTTFFSILPEWPVYLLILEAIFVVWSLMVWGVFQLIKNRSTAEKIFVPGSNE